MWLTHAGERESSAALLESGAFQKLVLEKNFALADAGMAAQAAAITRARVRVRRKRITLLSAPLPNPQAVMDDVFPVRANRPSRWPTARPHRAGARASRASWPAGR